MAAVHDLELVGWAEVSRGSWGRVNAGNRLERIAVLGSFVSAVICLFLYRLPLKQVYFKGFAHQI